MLMSVFAIAFNYQWCG